ncbi:Sodium/calcium exchanger protein-domain-containing protein [Neohortaea acidophila]|uniref:Vacuolar calcium ion transporter n=1 Tax=Neohortaea acidophila TaxID=245834 RepID=A0A6A6PTF6_9PEZI|nr:Sodium/calcium exchanger protein-domain-containing protein [Neohortaea acidophila]KAF2482964.1 Sodium/calcium exchanger protein-domain-containing protein [Neohortaea acidophila]
MPWKKEKDQDSSDLEETDTEDSSKKTRKNPNITLWSQVRAVFGSWINLLLVFVPAGIALHFSGVNRVVVFVINFIAIIPLAGMLAYATEELALYIGEVLGGLLNASFGNAVELIVGVIALAQGKILIVKTSLIGSMLSNLLLVLGMCFFFGGLRRVEQFFNVTVAQTAASLLALATGSLIIPTAFKMFASNDSGVAPSSRGTAVLLLVTYACYLYFQLSTHSEMYNAPSAKSPKKPSGRKSEGDAKRAFATIGGRSAGTSGGQVNQENLVHDEEKDDGEIPQLTRLGALITLAGTTVLVALCAEFMVSAIDAVAGSVSPEFIGLILLPIVGNAAEHATAVTVAIKDKMDLAIGVAVGSSLQIALLVLPLMVMLSWWGVGAGKSPEPMTLSFDGFQIIVLFVAVIVVNYLIQDGKSHWLEGVMLQITYLIIALSAWFYPVSAELA